MILQEPSQYGSNVVPIKSEKKKKKKDKSEKHKKQKKNKHSDDELS